MLGSLNRSLFGGMTNGLGGLGYPQVDNAPPMDGALPQMQAAPKKKFDVGALGEMLMMLGSVANGNTTAPLQFAMMRRQREQQLSDYEMKRQNEWEDWQKQQQWLRDNPKPINNDTVNDYNFWKSTLTPDQFEKWLANRIDPPVYRQDQFGNFYPVNKSPASPPNASDFGPIVDTLPGGAGGNASGGFR